MAARTRNEMLVNASHPKFTVFLGVRQVATGVQWWRRSTIGGRQKAAFNACFDPKTLRACASDFEFGRCSTWHGIHTWCSSAGADHQHEASHRAGSASPMARSLRRPPQGCLLGAFGVQQR